MKGDFTRFTDDSRKQYTGVLKQQGRVDLDADWNEYVDIQKYLTATERKDVIGLCGVPLDSNGFKIQVTSDGGNLTISPGRIYVDGILCVNDRTDPVLLTEQEHLPGFDLPTVAGVYLAYIDVWERHITAIEDPEIKEVALGGPDTTTRIKTIWQVRLENVSNLVDPANPDCAPFCPCWVPKDAVSAAKLSARVELAEESEEPCVIPPGAGYRGPENRLYRVEIHKKGKAGDATFKWSRDNGSVVFPINNISVTKVTLERLGRDEVLTLRVGDWVEVLDDETELKGQPGTLAQIAPDGIDEAERSITLSKDVSSHKDEGHRKVRRWDHKDTPDTPLATDGAIKVVAGQWVTLEDGVQVSFEPGCSFQTGDYWLIPARTQLGDILWPKTGDEPDFQPPHGIKHHYCGLALVRLAISGTQSREFELLSDCRPLFPPLTKVRPRGCCVAVQPGEDVQQAVDTVIAAGGGCVSLCRGLHQVDGPLLLRKARNLTICGESTATLLHLRGVDGDGRGGIVLSDCTRVSLEHMFVLGDGLPALIITRPELKRNRTISLRSLSLLNRSAPGDSTGLNCALRLAHAEDVLIEDCRMAAQTGIVCLFGDKLPNPKSGDLVSPVSYGDGVESLHLHRSQIRYGKWGIWLLKADRWHLEQSQIEFLDGNQMKRLCELQTDNLSDLPSRTKLLAAFDEAMSATASTQTGTALKGFLWRDGSVRNCRLLGSRGLDMWFLIRGTVTGNAVEASQRGIHAFWLHDTQLSSNQVRCEGEVGVAFSFAGSYRAQIEDNVVRAATGLQNLAPTEAVRAFAPYLTELVRAYGLADNDDCRRQALWMLLEETVRFLKLPDLRDSLQQLLDACSLKFPALSVVAQFLYPALNKLQVGLPMPIIALALNDNDIEGTARGVHLTDFLPLGGMRVVHNRVHTVTGQAVCVKSHQHAVNPHLVVALWRYLFKALLENILPALRTAVTQSVPDTPKGPVLDLLTTLSSLLSQWAKRSEAFLEGDYRIEANSVHSMLTAIESNLFELAILNNHVTLQESPASYQEIRSITDALAEVKLTAPLATPILEGSPRGMTLVGKGIVADETLRADRRVRAGAADVLNRIGLRTTDARVGEASAKVALGFRTLDLESVGESLPALVGLLRTYVDTYGIWVKGAGCRIVGNHVLVPADVNPETWARGGIRFWDDEGTPIWAIAFLIRLANLFLPGLDLDPLLGITETLIDNNEVVRGTAHGIEIAGIAGVREGLSDLKIRHNQIRGMAGAGILIDEEALAIGVDIEGNHIADCCTRAELVSFAPTEGALVVRNAALCRILNNRISFCGNVKDKVYVFAIDLELVLDLTLAGNHLLHHGEEGAPPVETRLDFVAPPPAALSTGRATNGAVRLSHVLGQVAIHDNDIWVIGGGVGLELLNLVTKDRVPLSPPQPLVAALYGYAAARTAVSAETPCTVISPLGTWASVQDNRFRATQILEASYIYGFRLENLNELIFSGNHARAGGKAAVVIDHIGRGVISHNLLDQLCVSNMTSGAIIGNACTQAPSLPTGIAALKVEHNVP